MLLDKLKALLEKENVGTFPYFIGGHDDFQLYQSWKSK